MNLPKRSTETLINHRHAATAAYVTQERGTDGHPHHPLVALATSSTPAAALPSPALPLATAGGIATGDILDPAGRLLLGALVDKAVQYDVH